MTELNRCPDCGAEIPDDAPEGICRKCLMRLGFENTRRYPLKDVADPSAIGTVTFKSVVPKIEADRYNPLNFHARGGMGEVWRAKDSQIGRIVALKKLLRQKQPDRERFLAEVQITGQLEHPGVIPVHDVGIDKDGQTYYVMKFVDGCTFDDAIDDFHAKKDAKPWELEVERRRLLESFIDLCEVIAYAHSRGVIHRDIKPSNVMIGAFGETFVVDWGLAKVVHQEDIPGNGASFVALTSSGRSAETKAGSLVGTPSYMPPEMASNGSHDVGPTCDVYLLGGTLYCLLTGHAPRRGSSYAELVQLARDVEPESPSKHKPDIPRALEAICMKALARRESDRYETAQEMAEDIRRYLAWEPVSAYHEPLSKRILRWVSRHRKGLTRVATATLFVGVIAAAVIGYYYQAQKIAAAEQFAQRLESDARAQAQIASFRDAYDKAFFQFGYDAPGLLDQNLENREAAAAIDGALTFLDAWGGSALTEMPRVDKHAELKDELYDLWLLKAALTGESPTEEEAKQALDDLARAEQLREPTREFYRIRSRCQAALHNDAEAEADLQKSNDEDTPTRSVDRYLIAEQLRSSPATVNRNDPIGLLEKPELNKAIEAYDTALEEYPDHYWSLLQLGRCHLSANHLGEALAAFRACVALKPDAAWGLSAQGLAYARLKEGEKAIESLDRALEIEKDFLPALLNRGWVKWKYGEENAAIHDLTKALALPSGEERVYANYYLGQIYEEQANRASDASVAKDHRMQAVEAFEQFAEDEASFRNVHGNLASLHLLLGEREKALESLDTFLRLSLGDAFDPDSAEAHFQRGRFLSHRAREELNEQRAKAKLAARDRQLEWEEEFRDNTPEDALAVVIQIVKRPESKRTRNERRALSGYLRDKDPGYRQRLVEHMQAAGIQKATLKLALAEFEAAEEDLPIADLYFEQGVVYEKLGSADKALTCYKQGLELEPDNLRLLRKRGYAYYDDDRFALAKKDFAAAVVAEPDPNRPREEIFIAEANFWLGYINALQSEGREAERAVADSLLALQNVALGEKKRSEMMHNFACIYAELMKKEEQRDPLEKRALDYLKRAMDIAIEHKVDKTQAERMLTEPAFDGTSLREHEEFKRILKLSQD